MRAWRSISRSVSRRSSRRIIWFREALDLCQAPGDRGCFLAEPVAERAPDCVREDDLELIGRLGERLDLEPGTIERGGDLRWQGVAILHDADGNVAVG